MKRIQKIIISILFSFSIPLILPIIAQILIKINFFNNFEELSNLLNQFCNLYIIIYVLIGFAIILYFNKKLDGIREIVNDIKISFKIGNIKITIEKNNYSSKQKLD